MNISRNEYRYDIPSIGQLINVSVVGKHYCVSIAKMMLVDMESLDHKLLGVPNRCAIDTINNKIWFWPTPDKSYQVELVYFPPATKF